MSATPPIAAGSQILYRHGPVTEFYRNGPRGLEQGFTLRQRPHEGTGPIIVALATGGALVPRQLGSQVLFRTQAGSAVLRYGQLSATDVTGRRLPARLAIRKGRLELQIDDRHALYPLLIDPFIVTALSPATVETGNRYPVAVAISPDGKSVYVGYEEGKSISQYSRNTETGALTPSSPATVESGNEPRVVTVSPDGKSVYVANFASGGGSSSVSQYSRNTETGNLTPLVPAAVELGAFYWPHGLKVSPDGKSVYVANYNAANISQFSRNTNTGALTALSPATVQAGARPNGIVISPDGTSVYTANREGKTVSQYSRNTTTGALTPLSPPTVGVGESPHEIAISPDGKSVYVPNAGSKTLSQLSRNTETGKLAAMTPATVETGTEPFEVEVSPDNQSVYVTDSGSNALSQYSRNGETGTLTALSPATIGTGAEPYALGLSPDGHSIYVANKGSQTVSQYSRAFLPAAPSVVTGGASSVSGSGASLSATVNPNGGDVGECRFEYGTSEGYGSSVACSSLPGSGSSPVAVSASVTGLAANTGYHYRIVASNAGGTSRGADQTFTTLPMPTVTKLKPATGGVTGGTTVTITGTHLNGATAVKFGSTNARSFLVKSATSITAVAPTEVAGVVDVTVTTAAGTSATSPADEYSFLPSVTGLSPNAGPSAGGTTVVVSGTGFLTTPGATVFRFGWPKATSVNCTSTTRCEVTSPAHFVATVDVKATVNTVSSPISRPGDQFTYN
jgi:DNA-binding beta-propeller fold protein YncE